jgi:hypothetical protein
VSVLGYSQPRDNRTPAIATAAVLHAGLILALWYFTPPPKPGGNAVPINIVSSAPTTDSRPAEEAPQAQTAQAEEPQPEAKPQPAPPPPPPKPTPVTPHPAVKPPTPAPTPRPVQTQAKPTPAQTPPKTFDWSQIQHTIDSAARSAPRPAAAPRGPTRAETDTHARPDVGQGVSTSDIEGLSQLLNRLWLKNCNGADLANVTVRLTIDQFGMVAKADDGHARLEDDTPSGIRAISAVHKAQPYGPQFRGQTFIVKFDASKACANS